MKANELMIGDWVYNSFTNENYQIWPQFFSQVYHQDKEMNRDLADANIHPIPLTAEILERNGWSEWSKLSRIARSCSELIDERTSISFQIIDGEEYVYTHINRCGAGTLEFRKHLYYVHELQHALKLCGIDKEIVL